MIQTLGSFSVDLMDVPSAPPTQSDALVRFHPHTNADTYSMALMILHKSPTNNAYYIQFFYRVEHMSKTWIKPDLDLDLKCKH